MSSMISIGYSTEDDMLIFIEHDNENQKRLLTLCPVII